MVWEGMSRYDFIITMSYKDNMFLQLTDQLRYFSIKIDLSNFNISLGI